MSTIRLVFEARIDHVIHALGATTPIPCKVAPHPAARRVERRPMSAGLDARLTSETFIVGPANRLAYTAALRVAEAPASAYNPLILYGAPGLGKTHLLMAIGDRAVQVAPRLSVRYASIVSLLDGASANGPAADPWNELREVRLLLLDDLQRIDGRADAQAALAVAWDAIIEAGGQIVLASDLPIRDIGGLDAVLGWRCARGLVVDIAPPDHETRLRIVQARLAEQEQSLTTGAADALARLAFRSVRDLRAGLSRILAAQEREGRLLRASEIPERLRTEAEVRVVDRWFLSPEKVIWRWPYIEDAIVLDGAGDSTHPAPDLPPLGRGAFLNHSSMAFKGSLAEASLADVCQLLALGLKTGCLWLKEGRRLGQVFFDRGRIAYARILNRSDRLGDRLVHDGVITHEQLAAALDAQARGIERRLGDVLVERGWMRAEDVERYVRRQVDDAILHLFTWSQGSFSFISGQQPEFGRAPFAIAVEGVLLEAARRIDEGSEVGRPEERGSSDAHGDPEARDLAAAFFRAGMLEDAERELRRVLELCPDDAQARQHLALIALQAGRTADAVDELVTLLETNGPSCAAFMNLAAALQCIGRDDDAVRALSEAERLRPDSAAVALERGIIALRRQQLPEAMRLLETSRDRAGPDARLPARWYYHVGLATALAGDAAAAAALVGEALEGEGPESPPLLLLRGLLAEQRGDLEAAEHCYSQVITLDPSIAQAHKDLGDVAYRRGAHELALSLFQRTAELAPDLGDDLYTKLGNLHYRARNRDAALRCWKRALEINPDNDAVTNNLDIVMRAGRDASSSSVHDPDVDGDPARIGARGRS